MSRNPPVANVGIKVGNAHIGASASGSENTFKYGCSYCGRANVCAGVQMSCGRADCNKKWSDAHSGFWGGVRQAYEAIIR